MRPGRSALRDPATAVVRALDCARDPGRLQVVRRTGLLDAGSQSWLRRYVELAAELGEAPISLVSMVDNGREYFVAAHGTSVAQTPLEVSYGKHVAADGGRLVVPDAKLDAVLATNLSAPDLPLRAYVGAPVTVRGARVGAFCLADPEPRGWADRTQRMVDAMAAAVSAEVELRVRTIEDREATRTDALTALGNRRALAEAIEEALRVGRRTFLGLLDLHGFKAYNEAFGYPAGDNLLVRLAHRVREAIEGSGSAFRMGGDQFCVVADSARAVEAAHAAMAEPGRLFSVTASLGQVELPLEASEVTTAIGIADRRLYAEKRFRPGPVDQQLSAALAAALNERDGALGGHSDHVAHLARSLARAMGMRQDEIRLVSLAARLHDIGKMAISEHILNKPGPLNEEEWAQMRCHTMIGERILAAAPALAAAAALVRSSHERWDGRGYPDGLRGEDIPLGARIIFVCDAYDAMRSERPYRRAFTHRRAIEELLGCAGTQFDPQAVEALTSLRLLAQAA